MAFYLGQEFDDYEKFKTALDNYGAENFVQFVTKHSKLIESKNKTVAPEKLRYDEKFKYSSLQMCCKHNGKVRKTGKGIRPNQRTFKLQCPCSITVGVCRFRQKLVVRQVSLEHNHVLDKDVYAQYPENRKLSDAEKHVGLALLDRKMKGSQVKQHLSAISNKVLKTKDIYNLKRVSMPIVYQPKYTTLELQGGDDEKIFIYTDDHQYSEMETESEAAAQQILEGAEGSYTVTLSECDGVSQQILSMVKVEKPKIWILREADHKYYGLISEFEAVVQQHFEVISDVELGAKPELGDKIEGAILTSGVKRLLQQLPLMPNLKIVSTYSASYDHIPVNELNKKGIRVTNTPDVLCDCVADLTMALLLASARKIIQGFQIAMKPAKEFRSNWLGKEVTGSTLGIIGLGGIGWKVAQRALGFNMDILYHSRKQRPDDQQVKARYFNNLHDMLPHCDFVAICCPLTAETTHLLGEEEFDLMKSDAHIINIARGEVIDQDALVKALATGDIGGAALDVTTPEPLPKDHPLLALDNVIITPHIGWSTLPTRLRMLGVVLDSLEAKLVHKSVVPNEVIL